MAIFSLAPAMNLEAPSTVVLLGEMDLSEGVLKGHDRQGSWGVSAEETSWEGRLRDMMWIKAHR